MGCGVREKVCGGREVDTYMRREQPRNNAALRRRDTRRHHCCHVTHNKRTGSMWRSAATLNFILGVH